MIVLTKKIFFNVKSNFLTMLDEVILCTLNMWKEDLVFSSISPTPIPYRSSVKSIKRKRLC